MLTPTFCCKALHPDPLHKACAVHRLAATHTQPMTLITTTSPTKTLPWCTALITPLDVVQECFMTRVQPPQHHKLPQLRHWLINRDVITFIELTVASPTLKLQTMPSHSPIHQPHQLSTRAAVPSLNTLSIVGIMILSLNTPELVQLRPQNRRFSKAHHRAVSNSSRFSLTLPLSGPAPLHARLDTVPTVDMLRIRELSVLTIALMPTWSLI